MGIKGESKTNQRRIKGECMRSKCCLSASEVKFLSLNRPASVHHAPNYPRVGTFNEKGTEVLRVRRKPGHGRSRQCLRSENVLLFDFQTDTGYDCDMQFITGKIVQGKIVADTKDLKEGSTVAILAEDEETFSLTDKQAAEIEESRQQIRDGNFIYAEDLLKKLGKK